MPEASAAATPGDTLRVTPSESTGGWAKESFCLEDNKISDASRLSDAGAAAALGPLGSGVPWAPAAAAARRKTAKNFGAGCFIYLG